ncbi:MAG TPA: hypothetical protein DDZ74_19300 [Pseudomonas sp.]|nr:hypothetical protein [Pseudomonas sp.]
MPTENRSSNTQMAAQLSPCPHCGQQDAFVEQLDSDASVVICQGQIDEHSACLARGPVGVQQHECEDQPGYDQAVKEWNKRAAAVPHPDPIVWMVGTAFWWTKEEAERDAQAAGLPVVAIGPMPTRQDEPAWFMTEGGVSAMHAKAKAMSAQQGLDTSSYCVPLYTHADPGEVERLRLERRRMDQALSACANERDTLRTLLVEALAFLDEAYKHDIGTQLKREIKAFYLSASAEPSAPVAQA